MVAVGFRELSGSDMRGLKDAESGEDVGDGVSGELAGLRFRAWRVSGALSTREPGQTSVTGFYGSFLV